MGRNSLKLLAGMALATTALSQAGIAQDFSGPYLGLQTGFANLNSHTKDGGNPIPSDADLVGMLFGVEGGFNTVLQNNILLGASADLSLSTASGNGFFYGPPSGPFELNMNGMGTVQARAGVVVGNAGRTLLFVSGGLAIAEIERKSTSISNTKKTHLGLIGGVGVEHMVTDTMSITADVSYVDLGTETHAVGETIKLNGIVGTVGVNIHF